MTLCSEDMMGSFDFFEETTLRKTVENAAKHHNGGKSSMVITALQV